jgi:hypothetical protein
MTIATRVLTALVLLAACVAGMSLTRRSAAAPRRQAALAADLNRRSEILVARIKAKEQVARQLLAGEVNLFEAAAWFRDLNMSPPEHASPSHRTYPGRDEGEKLCRQVIRFARVELAAAKQEQTEEAECRLEAEMEALLQAHRAKHGRVELPEE